MVAGRRRWNGVEDIGVGGPGPDRVLVPEVAAPGIYRICTAQRRRRFLRADRYRRALTVQPSAGR